MIFDEAIACARTELAQRRVWSKSVPFYCGSVQEAEALSRMVEPKTPEELTELSEGFFLPFPAIAIEDDRSCVGLYRDSRLDHLTAEIAAEQDVSGHLKLIEDSAEKPAGLFTHAFGFMEAFLLRPRIRDGYIDINQQIPDRAVPDPHEILAALLRRRDPTALAVLYRGSIIMPVKATVPYRLEAIGLGGFIEVRDRSGEVWKATPDDRGREDMLQNFQAASLQAAAINSPLNIVVKKEWDECVVVRREDGKGRPLLKRRVRMLVLPRQAAYQLVTGDKSATGQSRAAHARRRHWRTLRSERFTPERRGTRVCVRECWVGPRERTDEFGVRYEVCLDVGAGRDQARSPR